MALTAEEMARITKEIALNEPAPENEGAEAAAFRELTVLEMAEAEKIAKANGHDLVIEIPGDHQLMW